MSKTSKEMDQLLAFEAETRKKVACRGDVHALAPKIRMVVQVVEEQGITWMGREAPVVEEQE